MLVIQGTGGLAGKPFSCVGHLHWIPLSNSWSRSCFPSATVQQKRSGLVANCSWKTFKNRPFASDTSSQLVNLISLSFSLESWGTHTFKLSHGLVCFIPTYNLQNGKTDQICFMYNDTNLNFTPRCFQWPGSSLLQSTVYLSYSKSLKGNMVQTHST